MILAIISIIFGLMAFVVPIPIVIPILGVALGVNGYLKENNKTPEEQKNYIKIISIIGLIICSISVVLFFISKM